MLGGLTQFRSSNLGIRRLALVLAIFGAIGGSVWSVKVPFHKLEEQRWGHKYFVSEMRKLGAEMTLKLEEPSQLAPKSGGDELDKILDTVTKQSDKLDQQIPAGSGQDLGGGWKLQPEAPNVEHDGYGRIVVHTSEGERAFPEDSQYAPNPLLYSLLILPVIASAAVPWLLVHLIVWIISGFRVSAGKQPW